jgi:nicotinamidase-related amidase
VAARYAVQDDVRVYPARTALLVIDMQNDFAHAGGSLLVPDADATIPAIGRLLKLARANQVRVVDSREPTATATPNGRSAPSTHARAAGAGRSSPNLFQLG